MTQDLFTLLIPLLIFSLSISSWALFLLTKHDRTYAKLTLIPASLILAVAVPFFFTNLIGRAVPLPLPEKFNYIAHKTIITENKKTKIEVWTATQNGTRLHVIPYNKQTEEKLQMAERAKQGGSEVEVEQQAGRVTDADQSNIQIRIQNPENIAPKSP